MFDPAVLADEIFQVLGQFKFEVAIYGDVDDQRGVKVYEPKDARLFFTRPKSMVVSIHELGENSAIVVHLGTDTELASIQSMLDKLRNLAVKYSLKFSIDKSRRELSPRDFAKGLHESRAKLTGSTKSSYLKLEGARMILRHGAKIDDTKHAARSRNVNKVFVENSQGERFLMPSSNLMAGRAMTRHVSKGGDFHDDRGSKIVEMANQQMHAKTCVSYCRKNKKKLDEDVSGLIEACVAHSKTVRKTLEGLYRNYDKASVELDKQEDNMLLEDDALEEKINQLKNKLNLEDEEVMDRPTCESVVKIIGEGAFLAPEKEMQVLHAIGDDIAVEKEAWDNFKAGSLDLLSNPNVTAPQEKDLDALARAVSKVSAALNPKTSAAFANMLAHLSDLLSDGKKDVLFLAVAQRAVDLAADYTAPQAAVEEAVVEEKVEEGFAGLPIMNEGVSALESWFASFDESSLFEDDMDGLMTDNPLDDGFDPEDFNVDDFLVMQGDDFGYGDDTVAEKTVDASQLRDSLETYLANVDGTMSEGIEDIVDEDEEVSNVDLLLPIVIDRLEEEGFTVTGMDADETDDVGVDIDTDIKFRDNVLGEDELEDNEEILFSDEDDDLSREDVLLPSNPASDLSREVKADKDEDQGDNEDDEAYINRLVGLAGVKATTPPRTPQP